MSSRARCSSSAPFAGRTTPGCFSEEALAGGWFAASSPEAFKAFDGRFNGVFDKTPEQLASLAYDATALAVIVQRDIGDRRFDPVSLTDPEGFAGATGLFRLNPDGLAQHGLAVLEVARGQIEEVDPTPIRFETDPRDDPLFSGDDDLFNDPFRQGFGRSGRPAADPVEADAARAGLLASPLRF